ncbi:hypothetical protein WICPIJ_001174 [Wickerhamomyces pijperi]|uniref:Reverse transcriptase/retrotransposon-derived protein RNase H-like domain-containing protein n=1 Tax=Wickerhamomyces pijperi TaxID=599730 RepID=A0A9P8QE90_WICPI|nr:hypothetical protein WICPIJ_001174 [Wickerhamomyces pijperi]
MTDCSRRYSTFKSILGFYAFSVAFGQANAPEVLSKICLVSSILGGFSGFACFLSPILLREHAVQYLEQVLSRLKEHQLHLNLEKSVFFKETEFKWLGTPFCYRCCLWYYLYPSYINYVGSFIPKLSIICSPFQPLLAKNARFHWTDACESAFLTLKDLELDIMSKQSFAPGKPITILTGLVSYLMLSSV